MTCQNCGQKVSVQSMLGAAQQTCTKCGRLLMGELDRPKHTPRPSGFGDDPLPNSLPVIYGPRSSLGLWVGMFLGVAAGIGLVLAIGQLGTALRPNERGAILGALSGVLLTPVFALATFFAMIILPFSLDGILGDSLWSRISKAVNHRQLRHLFVPFLIYVVLPMAACAYGGARMRNVMSLQLPAALGAAVLGAMLGAMLGSLLSKPRPVA